MSETKIFRKKDLDLEPVNGHGADSALAQPREGPAQHVGGTVGGIHLFDGLGDVVVTLERTVMRVDAGPFSGMAQGKEE